MAITKQLHELTLDEIVAELEFAGVEKLPKRIDHARSALKKMFDKGEIIYTGEEPFYDADKVKEVAAKAEKVEKIAKVKEPKVVPQMVWLSGHASVGTRVFTRFGHNTIARIGYLDNTTYDESNESTFGVLKAELNNGGIVALSSCRATAVKDEYRDKYATFEEKTPSGKKAIGVEDELTPLLIGLTTAEMQAIATENNLDWSRWEHLNPGMQRMSLGNKLRGNMKKGMKTLVRGHVLCEGVDAAAA